MCCATATPMASVPMSTRSDTLRAATDSCLATYMAEH